MTQKDVSGAQVEPRKEVGSIELSDFGKAQIEPWQSLESVAEIAGAIKALELMTSFSTTMGAVQLYRVKQLYGSTEIPPGLVDEYGPDFKAFCHNTGIPYSTAKRRVSDIQLFGQEMLSRAEALNVPLSTLRQVKSLPEEQKQQVHKFLMSGEADRDAVRDYIAALQSANQRLDKLAGRDRQEMQDQVETLLEKQDQDVKVIKELKKEKGIREKMLRERENGYQADQLLIDLQELRARYHTLYDMKDSAIQDALSAFRDVLADFHGEKR